MRDKKIIMSTGMATLKEIKNAYKILAKKLEKNNIHILHCTSLYPAPTKNLNLNSLVASTPAISLAQESLFRQTGKIVSQKTKGSYRALAIILISLPLTFLIIYRIARNK
jgi:hypothetical protein